MRGFWRRFGRGAAGIGLALGFLAGCGQDAALDEILLAYSGDCQAYIEPCG